MKVLSLHSLMSEHHYFLGGSLHCDLSKVVPVRCLSSPGTVAYSSMLGYVDSRGATMHSRCLVAHCRTKKH